MFCKFARVGENAMRIIKRHLGPDGVKIPTGGNKGSGDFSYVLLKIFCIVMVLFDDDSLDILFPDLDEFKLMMMLRMKNFC